MSTAHVVEQHELAVIQIQIQIQIATQNNLEIKESVKIIVH